MGKHVCFLVSEHPFLDARIFKKEAKSLLKQGYQVTMIVPRKNGYLFDVDGSIFREKFRSERFVYEGIQVITYEQIYPEKNIKNLHVNLRSRKPDNFTDSLTQLGIEQKADFYHAHEFYSLYSGIGIKRALSSKGKNIKLIYDSHELDPDPFVQQAIRTKKIKSQMLNDMLKETDFIITVSESIKSWFLSSNPDIPIEVIYNSPYLASEYNPGQGQNQELVIAYEGVMNQKRGSFYKLMDIVEMCNKKFELKVILIGGSKVSEKDLHIPSHLKDKVQHIGWVNYDSISSAMKDADLGWVDLDAENSLNNRFAMPNKFFSYLNNGIPILANQCKDMESFIQQYNCGYIVKGLKATAEDYFQALLFLHFNRGKILEMSLNARKIMESHFSWEHMEKKLLSVYDRLSKDMVYD